MAGDLAGAVLGVEVDGEEGVAVLAEHDRRGDSVQARVDLPPGRELAEPDRIRFPAGRILGPGDVPLAGAQVHGADADVRARKDIVEVDQHLRVPGVDAIPARRLHPLGPDAQDAGMARSGREIGDEPPVALALRDAELALHDVVLHGLRQSAGRILVPLQVPAGILLLEAQRLLRLAAHPLVRVGPFLSVKPEFRILSGQRGNALMHADFLRGFLCGVWPFQWRTPRWRSGRDCGRRVSRRSCRRAPSPC